jgi:DNA-binding GntR family transcriptional regulator
VEQVSEIYTMRRLLETFATGEFARARPAKALKALQEVQGGLDDAQASGDPLVMMTAGTAFYDTVAAGGGNSYIQETLGNIHNRLSLIRYLSLHQPTRVEQSFRSIRSMCDAIIAGDKERAEELCAHHLDAAARTARAIVENGYTALTNDRASAA